MYKASLAWQIPLGAGVCQSFVEWNGSPLGYLALNLFEQSHTTTSRREVPDHLPVPGVVLELIEPHGKRMALVLGQPGDRLFYGFDGHIPP